MERLLAHWYIISKQSHSDINLVEFLAEDDSGPVISYDNIPAAPADLEDTRPQVKDPLEEVNVRNGRRSSAVVHQCSAFPIHEGRALQIAA